MSAADYHLTSSYATTIDAGIEAAYEAFLSLDPMGSLASRLGALGIDGRADCLESCETTGLTDGDGERELGFWLLWRFGPPGQNARIGWRVRLTEDGAGRTLLSIAVRASAGEGDAGDRIASGWPIVETIALQHAKGIRRAVDERVADSALADEPLRPPALSAVA